MSPQTRVRCPPLAPTGLRHIGFGRDLSSIYAAIKAECDSHSIDCVVCEEQKVQRNIYENLQISNELLRLKKRVNPVKSLC